MVDEPTPADRSRPADTGFAGRAGDATPAPDAAFDVAPELFDATDDAARRIPDDTAL